MDLIEKIRLGHGVDSDMSSRTADNPITILQGMLGRASERLSNDLYQVKTHFLLELIQNADDNTYVDVKPSLSMRIEDGLITVECNEVGFAPANVKAICDIGASTKTIAQGFIGEKGIGFKSVFTVADVVHISSDAYTFKFDRRERLGMITPIWDTTYPVKRGWTTFHLHLSSPEGGAALSDQINNLRPSLLLFLRKLRSLRIDVALIKRGLEKQIRFEHHNPSEYISNLKRIENERCVLDNSYFVFRHKADTYKGESKRLNIAQSEIVLAFPVTVNVAPMIRHQFEEVHAFLPLGCYGFRFIIQADFLTSSSREGILSDLQWNITLRKGIVDAFLGAVEHFHTRPSLQDVWFRYLPTNISDPFFFVVEEEIISRLKERNIFRSTDGEYRLSSQVLTVPSRFRSRDNLAPIILEKHLPQGLYYLTPSYDVLRDGVHFKRLGVRDMSEIDFLDGLGEMNGHDQIRCQPILWHETVCSELYKLQLERNTLDRQSYTAKILDLRILPLDDDSWAPARDAKNYVFHPDLSGVPDDLGLRSIAAEVKPLTSRHQLFQALGVKLADPKHIAQKILASSGSISLSSHIRHARFLFDYRQRFLLPNTKDLRLVDQHNQVGHGSEMYLTEGKLRTVLSSARFLHADYMVACSDADGHNWISWLHDGLGVNVHPRLINGELSPEFKEMIERVESQTLLEILRDYWPLMGHLISKSGIRELSNAKVTCEDGTVGPLCGTYLKTRSLAHHSDLPFLPVVKPEDSSWDFLRQLGVATDINVSFWINRLIQTQPLGADERILEVYKQLDARFYDDEDKIRNAFRERRLIFASHDGKDPKSFFGLSDVCWDGPSSMTSKVAIKRTYPFLRDFFSTKLHIPNAPPEILVEELTHVTNEWKMKIIPGTIQDRVISMFVDLSDLAAETLSYPVSRALQSLGQRSIFPVHFPSQGLRLCAAHEFYIPDKSRQYAKLFHDQVPLLAISSAILSGLQPFLDLPVFKQRMRYLETSVLRQAWARGRRILDTVATAKYASRVECITRVVYASKRSKPTATQLDYLTRMQDMRIFTVDTIESTLSLVEKTITSHEDLTIESGPGETALTVLISQACPESRRDPVICREFGHLLDVDSMKLLSLVNQSMEMVSEILELEGIPEVSRVASEDRPQGDEDPSKAVSIEQPTSSQTAVQGPSPEIRKTEPSPPLDDELLKEIARLKVFPMTLGFSLRPDQIYSASTQRSTAQTAESLSQVTLPPMDPESCTVVDKPTTSSQVLSSLLKANSHVGSGADNMPVTEYQQGNGLLGELYVYRLLCSDPDLEFGLENWTSELRGQVEGYAPYEGDGLADFMYKDRRGMLTGRLYGEEIKEKWKDQWPTYHIEVKTTSGAAREPFFMSRRQFNIALNLTQRGDTIPTDLFVIFRVSGVRTPSKRSHRVYLDPHRKLYDGGLQIISEHVQILFAE